MPNVMKTGIPLEKVEKKLKQLAKALGDYGMGIGVDFKLNTECDYNDCNKVQSAKITVYFFEEDLVEEKND